MAKPVDVPPYQLQLLVSPVLYDSVRSVLGYAAHVSCAQALDSEIYVGCSNGELLRFALQASEPNAPESYALLSRQSIPNDKPVDEIVLAPSISRALVLADHQLHFYTIPALDMVPSNIIKPIRNVVTFAVDDQHIRRPLHLPSDPHAPTDPIEFCVIKRSAIALYSLRERLFFQKEIPLPQGGTYARRTGRHLCIADKQYYNLIDLAAASLFPILPLSQAPDADLNSPAVKPHIAVVGPGEFLLLSWNGVGTMGVFITGEGEAVRGTLEWSSHPLAICLDYPYVAALLPNETIEIHSIETQAVVQVIPAPASSGPPNPAERRTLIGCMSSGGFLVPSTQRSDKLRAVPVKLLRERETGGDIEREEVVGVADESEGEAGEGGEGNSAEGDEGKGGEGGEETELEGDVLSL